jgi:hypothetical protein
MEKVTKSVDVPKNAAAVGDALVQVAKATKQALADGWQPGQDIPAILLGSFQPLTTALAAVGAVPAEAKEDAADVALAFAITGHDVYEALK